MATSKSSSVSETDYHEFTIDESRKDSCRSKMCWLLLQIYHYTIGSCCYTPLKWLCATLFNSCCCHQSSCNCWSTETTYYEVVSEISLPDNAKDSIEWKRTSKIDKADSQMKCRLRHQFQDHIQKWTDRKHQRFPWTLVLHLLLLVSVTVQVCVRACKYMYICTYPIFQIYKPIVL